MKNVNDIFTITRDVNFSVGGNCFLAHLEGGLILLGEYVTPCESHKLGSTQQKVFTFKCVIPGKAAVQFAKVNSPGGPVIFEEILPVEIASGTKAGGWSEFQPVDKHPEALKVFKEASKGLLGVDYTPLTFSQQVVKGMNYRFICSAKAVVEHLVEYHAEVSIYQGLNTAPVITGIVNVPK